MKLPNVVFAFLMFVSSLGFSQELPPITSEPYYEPKMGVGIGVGSIEGLSLLYKYDRYKAAQSHIAIGDDAFFISADHLWLKDIFNSSTVTPYIGVGGFFAQVDTYYYYFKRRDVEIKVKEGEMNFYGVEMPIGAHIDIPATPVQIYAELVPTLMVEPVTDTYLNTEAGVRLLF